MEGSSETTEKVKKSLSNILGVITDTLAPPPDKTIDCDVITLVATPAGTTEVYDSTKVRLNAAFRGKRAKCECVRYTGVRCWGREKTQNQTLV